MANWNQQALRHRWQDETPWYYWIRGCTKHDSSKEDITILRETDTKPARAPHKLTPDQAIKLVVESIKLNGIGYPSDYRPRAPNPEEFPYFLFNELDEVLFAGVLKGNVLLKFEERLPTGFYGMITQAGFNEYSRITISLSKGLRQTTPHIALDALLHQMIHAFLLQCCGYRNPGITGPGHDLQHGKTFSLLTTAICSMLFRKFEHAPSRVGAALPPHQTRQRPDRRPCARPALRGRRSMILPKTQAGSNLCGPGEHLIPWRMASQFLKEIAMTTELPKLDLEAKCPRDKAGIPRPLTQYVHTISSKGKYIPILRTGYTAIAPPALELVYKDRAVPIPLSSLSAHVPSLASKKAGTPLPFLVEDDLAFELVYTFLMTGQYAKPINSSMGRSQFQCQSPRGLQQEGLQCCGPPRILRDSSHSSVSSSSDGTPVLSDVRAARLGHAMSIPELEAAAMARLWSHEVCTEDPIDIVEYAYYGPQVEGKEGKRDKKDKDNDKEGEVKKKEKDKDKDALAKCKLSSLKPLSLPPEPDAALRDWVRTWLALRPVSGGQSNLDLLKERPEWSRRWRTLRERGGCLLSDIDATEDVVQKEVEKEKQYEREKAREKEILQRTGGFWPPRLSPSAALSVGVGAPMNLVGGLTGLEHLALDPPSCFSAASVTPAAAMGFQDSTREWEAHLKDMLRAGVPLWFNGDRRWPLNPDQGMI